MTSFNAKQALDRVFPRENVRTTEDGASVNVRSMSNTEINQLSAMSHLYLLEVKRSGDKLAVSAKSR